MRTWMATYTNPETGNTNTYLLTDEELVFMDDVVYVDEETKQKVYDPTKIASITMNIDGKLSQYTRLAQCKCLWMYDANRGYDTLRRVYISNYLQTEFYSE